MKTTDYSGPWLKSGEADTNTYDADLHMAQALSLGIKPTTILDDPRATIFRIQDRRVAPNFWRPGRILVSPTRDSIVTIQDYSHLESGSGRGGDYDFTKVERYDLEGISLGARFFVHDKSRGAINVRYCDADFLNDGRLVLRMKVSNNDREAIDTIMLGPDLQTIGGKFDQTLLPKPAPFHFEPARNQDYVAVIDDKGGKLVCREKQIGTNHYNYFIAEHSRSWSIIHGELRRVDSNNAMIWGLVAPLPPRPRDGRPPAESHQDFHGFFAKNAVKIVIASKIIWFLHDSDGGLYLVHEK